MIDPYLTRSGRTLGGEVLLGGDIATVGAPGRLVEQPEVFLGNLPLVGPVGAHDPDVVASAAVRGKGDTLAVGRKARLDFPGKTLGYPGGCTARNRHGVDIAQQRKGHHPAIGRDIDIHPSALVGADRDLAQRGTARRGNVPLRLLDSGTRLDHRRSSLNRFAGPLLGQGLVGLRRIDFLLFHRVGRRRRRGGLGGGGLREE